MQQPQPALSKDDATALEGDWLSSVLRSYEASSSRKAASNMVKSSLEAEYATLASELASADQLEPIAQETNASLRQNALARYAACKRVNDRETSEELQLRLTHLKTVAKLHDTTLPLGYQFGALLDHPSEDGPLLLARFGGLVPTFLICGFEPHIYPQGYKLLTKDTLIEDTSTFSPDEYWRGIRKTCSEIFGEVHTSMVHETD